MSVAAERMVVMKRDIWGLELDWSDPHGDSGKQWTEGRTVVWKALQLGAVVHPPTTLRDESPNLGWWLGLTDLLCFGAGVDDLAEYLRKGFASGHEGDSPLQNFISANWGDSAAVLALYLLLHPTVRQSIYDYVHMCRGSQHHNRPDLPEINEYFRMLTGSHGKASINSDRDIELARALEVDRDSIVTDNLRETRPGDPAHLSAHFSFKWADSSTEIESGDTAEFFRHGGAVLHLQNYAGWYGKIHSLRRSVESDPNLSGDADRIDVQILGVGSIGRFVYDETRQCFVLEGKETGHSQMTE
jgi:hypothetical protein